MEVAKLSDTTSPNIVTHVKSMFARQEIPDQLLSDNGPKFSARFFAKIAEEYGFTQAPDIRKQMARWNKLSKVRKIYFRRQQTPLEGGISPAELLMRLLK